MDLKMTWMQTRRDPVVFLVDVDNTLLDNDGIQQDLKDHIEQVFGRAARERYWRILEDLFVGRRRRLPAPQGRACGAIRRRGWARADLYP
jgi:hypothetical protein